MSWTQVAAEVVGFFFAQPHLGQCSESVSPLTSLPPLPPSGSSRPVWSWTPRFLPPSTGLQSNSQRPGRTPICPALVTAKPAGHPEGGEGGPHAHLSRHRPLPCPFSSSTQASCQHSRAPSLVKGRVVQRLLPAPHPVCCFALCGGLACYLSPALGQELPAGWATPAVPSAGPGGAHKHTSS